mmetsp:Transcript_38645/g.124166  ORF Transcript_38645/g.124166 Transcript_38645/m.124166 type:complete len:111 (+) Transcript_38645:1739-2071(+)
MRECNLQGRQPMVCAARGLRLHSAEEPQGRLQGHEPKSSIGCNLCYAAAEESTGHPDRAHACISSRRLRALCRKRNDRTTAAAASQNAWCPHACERTRCFLSRRQRQSSA